MCGRCEGETRLKQPWHTHGLRVPRLFQPCLTRLPIRALFHSQPRQINVVSGLLHPFRILFILYALL